VRLVLAGRRSDLARIQVYQVARALERAHPRLRIHYAFKESLGDRNLSEPLWQMPEKGVFTEDFVDDLVERRCDLVVHSFKDLPTEPRPATQIAATLPRADLRDLLLLRKDRVEEIRASGNLRVLSSSPRRAFNLDSFLREALPYPVQTLRFDAVRGNVPTRLRKLLDGDADGLVVAKAALDRLLTAPGEEFHELGRSLRSALARCLFMILPLKANPSAAGQGALAIETARGRSDLADILAAVNDSETYGNVEQERRLLASFGGGCQQKIGVSLLSRSYGRILSLRGESEQGEILERFELWPCLSAQPRAGADRIWPLEPQGDTFFVREPLPAPGSPPEGRAFWVARAEALPKAWSLAPEQIVWTAGLNTWKKLARRGVWVHGSAEGLGEAEDPAIDVLAGEDLRWLKLTHEERPDGRYETLPTYRLRPKEAPPRLAGKTHYYWSSGSAFLRALSLHPGIRDGWHACGPGNSYRIIRDALGDSSRLRVALSHASWLAEVSDESPDGV
jgi:hydroxymethylbilane synthase